MSASLEVQPVFDPEQIGRSLDIIKGQLPLSALRLSGTVLGEMTSRQKGQGAEIDGIQPYVPGDNPRYIDQKVTARQPDGWPQVRHHMRDITPSLWVVTDVLKSGYAANTDLSHQGNLRNKQRLGLSAVMSTMRVGEAMGMPSSVMALTDQRIVTTDKQPVIGRRHLYKTAARMVEVSQDRDPAEPLKMVDLLEQAAKQVTASVVVIVSGFRDEPYKGEKFSWEQSLNKLKKNGNDILAIELVDPRDFELQEGARQFIDRQTGKLMWIGHSREDREIRRRFPLDAQAQQQAINRALISVKAHHMVLGTDRPRWRDDYRRQLKTKRIKA